MKFIELGKHNEKVIVLIHPSVVMWDYYEYVIPLLENRYYVIVPALPDMMRKIQRRILQV